MAASMARVQSYKSIGMDNKISESSTFRFCPLITTVNRQSDEEHSEGMNGAENEKQRQNKSFACRLVLDCGLSEFLRPGSAKRDINFNREHVLCLTI